MCFLIRESGTFSWMSVFPGQYCAGSLRGNYTECDRTQTVAYRNVWLISISLNPRTSILCTDLWGPLVNTPIETSFIPNKATITIIIAFCHHAATNRLLISVNRLWWKGCLYQTTATLSCREHKTLLKRRSFASSVFHSISKHGRSSVLNPSVRWHTVSILTQWQPLSTCNRLI